MSFADARKCEEIKKDGERCRKVALKGEAYCLTHIGRHSGGKKPITFSPKIPKTNIFNLIEESRHDPSLLDIKEDIAVLDALFKKRIGQVVDEAFSSAVIKEIASLVEKRSEAIARYFKTEKDKAETFNLIQIGYILSCAAEVVRRYITDPNLRKKIGKELMEIPYDGAKSLEPVSDSRK